ncbi:hypothetical protein FSOLCH5_001711 [Fusarium solani]
MCQVVYSPRVLFILSVFLTFLLTIISIALGLRWAREGLYSREDASEYFRHKKCRPRWAEEFYGKHGGGSRPFHHRRMPWHLFFFSTVVFIYVFVLWGVGGIGGYHPSGPGDETWFSNALALNKAAGTLMGSKPLAFTTLGVPGFNERSVDLVAGFIFFNWLVFVGLPSALLDVIFYVTAGRPVNEKEHVMAPSTMFLSLGFLYVW